MTSKIRKRIKANRIFAYLPIRDHFGSHPGRMQWDLCGHPLFYWALKAVAEAKHVEKVLVWTEIESAEEIAKQLSNKIVVLERTLDECKEPMQITVDDLKTPKSKVWRYSPVSQPEKIPKALGFEPTAWIIVASNFPLIRAESLDKLVEKYFEDDEADSALLVHKIEPNTWRKNPLQPQYLLPVWKFPTVLRNRQEYEQTYRNLGAQMFPWKGLLGYLAYGKTVFVEVPFEESVDVHSEKDFELAKFYMEKRLRDEAI